MTAIVHTDPRICERRLRQKFSSDRAQWIEIVKAAVAARARCTDDNARSAPGFYAWDAATARARQMFRREGWEKSDYNGIETIVHPELRQMIAVMNTDAGTGDPERSPRNRTLKGPASEQVVDLNNQGELFAKSETGPVPLRPYTLWYLCVFDDGRHVRAELSCPSEYRSGYVVKFSERIFLIQDGDWEKITVVPDNEADEDPIIDVRRK